MGLVNYDRNLAMSEASESNEHAPRTDRNFKFDLSSTVSRRLRKCQRTGDRVHGIVRTY